MNSPSQTITGNITQQIKTYLAENLSTDWKDVARGLALNDAEIRNIEEDNKDYLIKEVIRAMLTDWQHKNGENATVDWLRRALFDAKRKDMADQITAWCKAQTEPSTTQVLQTSYAENTETLSVTKLVPRDGPFLKVGETGVQLEIPPDACPNDNKEYSVRIKIHPHNTFNEHAKCFEDQSTTVVEIQSNELQLQKPVKLTLPHCLVLRDEKKCKVRVLQSHHREGETPNWEDISASAAPELTDDLCKMSLKQFGWIKFEIDGEYVKGKTLFIYSLIQNIKANDEKLTFFVGYSPALPDGRKDQIIETGCKPLEGKLCARRKGMYYTGGHWQYLFFSKQPKEDLKICMTEVIPSNFTETSSYVNCEKIITYEAIRLSQEKRFPFTFSREDRTVDFPTCHVKVSHLQQDLTLCIDLEDGVTED